MADNSISQQYEIWKTVYSFPNFEVSNLGNLRSIPRFGRTKGKIIKQALTSGGYRRATLNCFGVKKLALIHRLVAEAFDLDISQTIDHINGDKLDNRLENLRACSLHQNICYRTGANLEDKGIKFKKDKRIKRWSATVYENGRTTFIGLFLTRELAKEAIDKYNKINKKEV